MDLNAVQVFVGVVEAGSLTAAANRLGTPLATVSRRIRELERELGVQLLERSARGVQLTDAGTRLHEQAVRSIETLQEAEQALRNDQVQLRGTLRLSLPPAFEPWWDLLAEFQRHYPDVALNVFSTDRRVNLVEDGIDVALRVGNIAHDNMVARRLLSYRHLVVASPALLASHGEPSAPEDLHRFPCATWGHGPAARSHWQLGGREFIPRAVLTTNDYLHLRSRALAGEIVTELPPFLAAAALHEGRLQRVLPALPMPSQEISLLYPQQRHPSSVIRAYLDFCQSQLSQFVSGE